MTQKQRLTYWQDLVKEQSRSGLDVTSFCRDNRINRQRFYLWRQRFQRQAPLSDTFLELVPVSQNATSGVRLRLDHSLSIELDRCFDPATLKQVLVTLRAKGPCLP